MCEASAYLAKDDGTQELILERVDTLAPHDDGILLCSVFGQQRFIRARVKELALVEHRIVLEPTRSGSLE